MKNPENGHSINIKKGLNRAVKAANEGADLLLGNIKNRPVPKYERKIGEDKWRALSRYSQKHDKYNDYRLNQFAIAGTELIIAYSNLLPKELSQLLIIDAVRRFF